MALRPHGLLIVTRLLFAAAIAAALPLSHLWWGHPPEEANIDGPPAFGFLLVFFGIGVGVAIIFVIIASSVHLFLRGRPTTVGLIDAGATVALLALLIWGGVTATYSTGP